MKKNYDLWSFSALGLSLLCLFLMVFQRLSGLIQKNTLYYCQTILTSFTAVIPTCELKTYISWIAGSIITLLIFKLLFSYIKTYVFVKKASDPHTNKRIEKIKKRYQIQSEVITLSYDEPLAFCFGLIRTKIYCSNTILSLVNDDELAAILLHEYAHILQNDSTTLCVASCVKQMFPFFPILGDLFLQYKLHSEIRCDRFAKEKSGGHLSLISALGRLLEYETPHPMFVPAIADTILEERIKLLLSDTTTNRPVTLNKMRALITGIMIVVFSGFLLIPSNPTLLARSTTQKLSCIPGTNCSIQCSAIPESMFSLRKS